jgi:hypothetical protein
MMWIVPGISSFQVGGPSSSAWSGGGVPWYEVYVSPVVCHWREPIVSKVLGRSRQPSVPGYITPTITPEPSIERVAEADHSTVGGTATHMVLWALPWYSVVRMQGQGLHDLNLESCGGAHRVAPEAASEEKAQAEAKFHK